MLNRGWRGYTQCALIGGGFGRIAWSHERPDMGFHLSMPASCLADFARLSSTFSDLARFIDFVQDDLAGHVVRLDLAWDDKAGLLDMDVMAHALKDGLYTSLWRGGVEISGWGALDGSRTLLLGSKTSRVRLRVYDKAAERGVDGHWVRVELQARKERANALAVVYKGIGEDPEGTRRRLAGILRRYIEFREPTADSNRSRWPMSSWWVEFLGHAEKAHLPAREGARTIEDVQNWIAQSAAPSLAVLEEVMGSDEAWIWLYQTVEEAKPRLSARHRAIIAAAAAKQELKPSSVERREEGD